MQLYSLPDPTPADPDQSKESRCGFGNTNVDFGTLEHRPQLRDKAFILKSPEASSRLLAHVLVRVVQTSKKRFADLRRVGVSLHSQPKDSPIAHLLVGVGCEPQQTLNRRRIIQMRMTADSSEVMKLARLHRHAHAVLGAQGDNGLRFHFLTRIQP